MKVKKHISEFFLEALARSLRASNREADAKIVDGIDPKTFTLGYANTSAKTFGTSGQPNRANGGAIVINTISLWPTLTAENGVTSGTVPETLNFLGLLPEELRPPYLGYWPGAVGSPNIDPFTKADVAKTGCYYLTSNYNSFVVVVGSDESPTDIATVIKYLPFDMNVAQFESDTSNAMGALNCIISKRAKNGMADLRVRVWQSTSPAETSPKATNPGLPVIGYNPRQNVAPENYTTIPALSVTIDWAALNGRYDKRVHFNQIFIDAVSDALEAKGDKTNANWLRACDPKTFLPFQVTFDTTAKTTTLKGAQDKHMKVYFQSITFNSRLASASDVRMYPGALAGLIYKAEAGISIDTTTTYALAKSSKSTKPIFSQEYGYMVLHVPTGTEITPELLLEKCPFDLTGMVYKIGAFNATNKNRVLTTFDQRFDTVWTGGNTFSQFEIFADL